MFLRILSENRSILKFERYIVKKIVFETNEKYINKNEEIELPFEFDTNTIIKDDKMEIELGTTIFQNAEENDYPFEMEVILKGYFGVENAQSDIKFFEKNAIAILFPYLRAIVSTYTVNANVAPILLPAMNINEYLRKKYEKD